MHPLLSLASFLFIQILTYCDYAMGRTMAEQHQFALLMSHFCTC